MCEIFCIEQNYNSDRSYSQIAVPNMSTQNVRGCKSGFYMQNSAMVIDCILLVFTIGVSITLSIQ